MSLVVLKLGGSLLGCATLAERLQRLLRRWVDDKVLIIVGGGGAADVVRDWSSRYSLSEEAAHWLAIRSLSLTRNLVKVLLPECGEAASLEEASHYWSVRRVPVLLDVEAFLRQAEQTALDVLPHTWNVTSDSIAAWVAELWSADELVLLKSTTLNPETDLEVAAKQELIDAHFPSVALKRTRIFWCNLTDELPNIQPFMSR